LMGRCAGCGYPDASQIVLTFWDLLETLISGSHDCGFCIKYLDHKLSLGPRNGELKKWEVGL
jgi:hypothetical protein